jgi:GT2 family glycosyltransferase
MTVLPDTSVVLCTRERPALVADSIDSVLSGRSLPEELVIVDQSETSNLGLSSRKETSGCRWNYVHSLSRGLSRARNEGARLARHSIIVFADDDELADPVWLEELVGALLESSPDTVVTGRVIAAPPEAPGGYAPAVRTDLEPRVYRGRVHADPLVTGNMAIHRRTFEAVGGFDPRLGAGTAFPGAEDNDFGFRLLEAGYTIRYVPEAVLQHRAWRDGASYRTLRRGYGRGQGAFFAKHASLRDPFMLRRMIGRLARVLGRVPRRMVRRRDLARGDVAYVMGAISGFTECLWRRLPDEGGLEQG